MDPASAIGVASASITFLEFSLKLIFATHSISSSVDGLTDQHRSLRQIAMTLDEHCRALDATAPSPDAAIPLSTARQNLHDVCSLCREKAQELRDAVAKLTLDASTRPTFLASFRMAIKGFMHEGRIDSLAMELEHARRTLHTALLTCLCEESRRSENGDMDVMLRLVQEMTQKLQQIRSDLHDKFPNQNDDERAYGDFSLAPGDPTCDKLAEVVLQRLCEDQTSQTLDTTADAEGQFDKNIAEAVISSLYFEDVRKRYEDIPAAYRNTLQWVWQEPPLEYGRPLWDSFTEWLRNEDASVYWITGKAGSGKSTLMKYLQSHPDLEENLSAWRHTVSDNPLLVLGYYAWYPSNSETQKSIDGLRRTILYEAVMQDPSLISIITPRRWMFHRILQDYPFPRDWTSEELAGGISNLLAQCTSLRLVIFIDGLDEFSLPPKKLIDAILSMVEASQKTIKVCAASRPWPEFRDSFEDFPSMKRGGSESLRLKDAILEKAGGVFLWVKVVTRLIIESIDRGDTTLQLEKVIEDLPEEMAELYDHIWKRIRPPMRAEASRIILFMEASFQQQLHYMTLWMEGEMHAELPASPRQGVVTNEQMNRMKKTIARRLHSRTFGLLEVDSKGYVAYLHRSAFEWKTQQALLLHVKGFYPDVHLIKAFRLLAARTKKHESVIHFGVGYSVGAYLFTNIIYHAARIAAAVEKPTTQELAAAAACLTEFRSEMTRWGLWYDNSDNHFREPFEGCGLPLLKRVGLKEAAAALGLNVRRTSELLEGFNRTHLRHAIFLGLGDDYQLILLGDKSLLNAEGVLDPKSRLRFVKTILESGVAGYSSHHYAKLGRELRLAAKRQTDSNQAWAAWYSDVADLLFKNYVDSRTEKLRDKVRKYL